MNYYVIAAVFVLLMVLIKLLMKQNRKRCMNSSCLIGKTAIVTGGNSGIGYEVALNLASRGCRVIIADRSDSEKSKEKIIRDTGNDQIVSRHLNLGSFASIRSFAKMIKETENRLDILINNAGTGGLGRFKSEDGLNLTMQVNYFGPVLLTILLIDFIGKSKSGRVIFTASMLSYLNNLTTDSCFGETTTLFQQYLDYGNSKACTLIASNVLAEKLKGTDITVNTVDPGFTHTHIHKKSLELWFNSLWTKMHEFISYLFTQTAEEGAQTTLHIALSRTLENPTGGYYANCSPSRPPNVVYNKEIRKHIWSMTENIIDLKPEEKPILF